jgi:large subunit ribosomal protein L24e
MPICSFCGEGIKKGTGKLFVYKTGKQLWFCSNKCEKNMLKLKRKPRLIKWTKHYEK